MIKTTESFVKSLSQLVSIWPALTVISFGLALAFQVGYFTRPLGMGFFHVSIEDLSKTGLMLFALLGVLYSILPILTASKITDNRFFRYIILAIGLIAVCGYDVFQIYQSNSAGEDFALLQSSLNLGCKIAGGLIVIFLAFLLPRAEGIHKIEVLGLGYLVLLILSFMVGMQTLFADSQNMKFATLEFSKEERASGIFVSERTYFYLVLNTSNCDFMVLNKSAVRTVTLQVVADQDSQRRAIQKCMLFR